MKDSDLLSRIPAHSRVELDAHREALGRDLVAWLYCYRDTLFIFSGVTAHDVGRSSGWDNYQTSLPSTSTHEELGAELCRCLLACKFEAAPFSGTQALSPKFQNKKAPHLANSKAKSEKDFRENSIFVDVSYGSGHVLSIESSPAIYSNQEHLIVKADISSEHAVVGAAIRRSIAAVETLLHAGGILLQHPGASPNNSFKPKPLRGSA